MIVDRHRRTCTDRDMHFKGRWLLSESDPTFQETIQASYDTFGPRLVDMAMSKSNWHVLAEVDYDEESCLELGKFGTRYIDGLCVNLYDHQIHYGHGGRLN